MVLPLTIATAPPKRSATSPNNVLRSPSARVSKGESVNSIKVPSTSRNKLHASDGGGSVSIMTRSLQDGRRQWSARVHSRPALVYFQCNFYTHNPRKHRHCRSEFLYFVSDPALSTAALRAAGGVCVLR